MKYLKKQKLLSILTLFFLLLSICYVNSPKADYIQYGVTFSPQQAKNLGLDWKKVYLASLDDLHIKNFRLSAYWNEFEPEENKYNFSDLDFQLQETSKRGAKVILSVGRRLPRWPECHEPGWTKNLSDSGFENALLSYIETTVNRYKDNQTITTWQVENEPYVGSFGPCPPLKEELLNKEIALVKKLDPARPILISDSGELSLWSKAYSKGDVFGTTLYRYVYNDKFNMYWVSYVPFWTYKIRAGFWNILYGRRQPVIIELQSEPWTTKGIVNTSLDEQFKTMSMEKFDKLLSIARSTGFSPQYLWGVEWWYYMKTTQNHPEYWDAAKGLMNKN